MTGAFSNAQSYCFGTDSLFAVVKVNKNTSKDLAIGIEVTVKTNSLNLD